MGLAQTGTGKTAAFTLPLLHRLSQNGVRPERNAPRALILAPTRELAGQIADSIRSYGRGLRLRHAVVYGGVPIRAQIKRLNAGLDILVATPGRLIDLMEQGQCRLDKVEIFILDEADRMLDMGFIPNVRKIASKTPQSRQTAFFSATMAQNVSKLARELLNEPVRVEVAPESKTAELVEQRVLYVPKDKKQALLGELLANEEIKRVLVFTRTKHGADRVARNLERSGVQADAIHGNKSQAARQQALNRFKNGRIRVLVATDIAARGIDVDGVTHVINYDLPNEPESYIHRIGRTARAGASGIAISFCDREEKGYLRDIERTIRKSVTVDEDHSFHGMVPANDPGSDDKKRDNFRKKRSHPKKAWGSQNRSEGQKERTNKPYNHDSQKDRPKRGSDGQKRNSNRKGGQEFQSRRTAA